MMVRLVARGFVAFGLFGLGYLAAQLLEPTDRSDPAPFEVPHEYRFLYDWVPSDSDVDALRSE